MNAFKWVASPFKWACDDGFTSAGNGASGTGVDADISAFVVLLLLLLLCSVIFGNESGIVAIGTICCGFTIVVSDAGIFGTVDWLMTVVSGIGAKGTSVEIWGIFDGGAWGNGIFGWAKGTFDGGSGANGTFGWAKGTFASDVWTVVGAAAAAAKYQKQIIIVD